MKENITSLAVMISLFGCAAKVEKSFDLAAYEEEVNAWHANRVDIDLKGPTGWLNLAGLFWLNEGFNTFGSGKQNDLVFQAKPKVATWVTLRKYYGITSDQSHYSIST